MAVNRYWVGGTGTWDSTSTAHWATASNGASGASAPVAGDLAYFDALSGGGTVTADASLNGIAFGALTAGAFTGTLDFTAITSWTFNYVSFAGTGTRTINMGSGTWNIIGGPGSIWISNTITGLTPTFQNATIVFNAPVNNRIFDGGGLSYGPFQIANCNVAGRGATQISGANTFASITVGSGNILAPIANITQTITGALNITGTQAYPSGLMASTVSSTTWATLSIGGASTLDWCAITAITKSGLGSITATNSLDLGRNVNFASITPPAPSSGGSPTGSGGQRVISG